MVRLRAIFSPKRAKPDDGELDGIIALGVVGHGGDGAIGPGDLDGVAPGIPRDGRDPVRGVGLLLVMRPSASISNGRSLILSISKGSPVDARRTQGHRVADGPLPTGEIGHGDGVTGIRLRRSPFESTAVKKHYSQFLIRPTPSILSAAECTF